MSFISNLFGGGSSAEAPKPSSVAATPRISDASSNSAGMEAAARLKARQGAEKSILTSGLGDTSAGPSNINRTAALGGNSSITS